MTQDEFKNLQDTAGTTGFFFPDPPMRLITSIRTINLALTGEESARLSNIQQALADEGVNISEFVFQAIVAAWGDYAGGED